MIAQNSFQKRPTARKGDLFLLLLLLGAALLLPMVVQRTQWVPEANRLILVTLWSALVGVLLAWSRLPDGVAWLISTILGLEFSINFAARLLPSLGILLGDLGQAIAWLWQLIISRSVGSAVPFARTIDHLVSQGTAMRDNVASWIVAVQAGQPTDDNTVLWMGVAFCIWILTWNAAFELIRHRRTFAALLPLGVGVVANVSFTDIGMSYVHIYMAITLLTLVWTNMRRLETIWTRLGLDFSPEVRRDALITGSVMAILIVVLGLLVPYVTYNDAVWFFWDRVGPRLEAFYEDLDKAFAGRNPVPSPTPGARGIGLGGHELGGTPLTSGRVLFWVGVSDPPPPPEEERIMLEEVGIAPYMLVPKRYWRERTYDVYTGHGWDSSERNLQRVETDQPWREINYPFSVVTQTFSIRDPSVELALAVNEPVGVDRPYGVLTRGSDDFVALSITGNDYTVVSKVPDVTVEDLQQAEGEYPVWVQERYLALPEIPGRVRQTAEQLVNQVNATTRYDKARAIETYIRTFTYDLELDPPPLDADVVEYFLFDAQRGYCDYSATAMVVMLRSVGVAARYASGYYMGVYDQSEGVYIVTEDNSHAWVEVYFPGYDWVEFEPTPSQSTFSFPASRGDEELNLEPLPQGEEQGGIPIIWWAGGGLLLLLLFVILWPPRWFRRALGPRQRVWRVYRQLLRRARWVGFSPYGGQTPEEYLRGLMQEVERRYGYATASARDIHLIGQSYLRARYSQFDITLDESDRVEGAWRRLRGILLQMALTWRRATA